MWINLNATLTPNFFEEENFETWLLHNLKSKALVDMGNWSMVIVVALDKMWWARNELIFHHIIPLVRQTIARSKKLVADILFVEGLEKVMGRSNSSQPCNKGNAGPNPGFAKLNCDEAVKSFANAAACVAVLRDQNGAFFFVGIS